MSSIPERMTTGPRPNREGRETWRFLGPALLLASTVVFGSTYFLLVYVPAERRQAVEAWSARLSAMAEDRSVVVSHWIADGVRDAATLAADPGVGAALGRSGDAAGARVRLRPFLDWFGQTQRYRAAYILDTSGTVVSQTSGAPPIDAPCLDLGHRVLTRGSAATNILALADGTPAVAFAVPVPPPTDPNDKGAREAPGVVVLEADPNEWLYPFLVREPIPSSTGEFQLVRLDRNEIQFLSPLRHNPARPLTLRVPATKSLASLAAVESPGGFKEFLDYRGVPVFAATRPIPLTSWGLVAKVDRHEALAEMHKEVRNNALLLAGALLAIAGAVNGLWRARRARLDAALAQSEERYRFIATRTSDGIFTVDLEGRVTFVSPHWLTKSGYTEADVLGRRMTDFAPEEYRAMAWEKFTRALAGEEIGLYEIPLLMADGSSRPFELNISSLTDESGALTGRIGVFRDITERKRAEKTLRESEARYRALFEGSADGIAIAEIGTMTFKYANPALCRMLGYSADEMRTMGVSEIHPKDAVQRVVAEFEAQARGDKTLATDIPCLRKDGSVVYVDVNTAKITIDDRPCNVGFFRDVSERKRAEEALRESEERFRILFEQAADSIFLLEIGPEGIPVIRDANSATFRLLGYQRDELIGQPVSFIDAAPDASKVVAERRRNVLSGTGALFEVSHRCKDGTIRDFECLVTELQIGSKTYAISVERDISERKRAQEELGRLAAVVKQTAEAVVMTDTAGKIMYVNPAFTRVTGYAAEEVLGQNPRILKSGKQPKEYYRELWDTILSGNTWHGHFVNRRKDGSLYEEEAGISPVRDSAGKITFFVAVKRDVTQEVMLEAQLRQAQKLEAIGRLAGGVAHDFNNLLQAMLGNTQLLRSGAVEKQDVASAVADLEEQIWRGAAFTRQLLQFSRREVLRKERLDINDVVRDAAKLLRRLVRENIALEARVADTPLVVDADRGQLAQVVMDLAVNATDSMPNGGSLVITAAPADPDTVVLSVTDTGDGIPEEIRDHIFDPFFTTKGVGKGTGLGLATVHGIVGQVGGRIELESRVGEGSTFRVFIPRAASGESAQMPEKRQELGELPQGRGERILLVEDEEGARKGLRAMLILLGYDVVAEGSAEEAGKLPADPPFDLLLSDVVLPGAAGNDLSRGLVDRWPGLKVILMSGYMEDEALREVIARGGVHFLRKPFDMGALAREVRTVLDEGTS